MDEAHNLVERSREMYSAEIYKEDFLAVKKIVKRYRPGWSSSLTTVTAFYWNIRGSAKSIRFMTTLEI